MAKPTPAGAGRPGAARRRAIPHLWGAFERAECHMHLTRFIPTPVGSDLPRWPARSSYPVHPHVCGEYTCRSCTLTLCPGSSPRLWGASEQRVGRVEHRRFIPTPVGSINRTPSPPRAGPVHPHACGEHVRKSSGLGGVGGSSPRLWGAWQVGEVEVAGERFIPTPVGSIRAGRLRLLRPAVHPHACGEHNGCSAPGVRLNGSSPRLWGAWVLAALADAAGRFIPTPVGSI